ncbi:M20 family metallopeptidase [Calycomorphotria hydatis]|uniref:Acetylornithine deacetylase n=1 Tax=Calycomorphotria hydatis TaxID=2528027 RepID=A0A517T4Y5_9PLAN|nr:M20 family metallopeptidase [Calycomorphotria hydatis]QDT63411.1 Acetylornithine deacetylase [Calycomorphotria hydatis]
MDALQYTKELTRFVTPSSVSNANVSDYVAQQLGELGFETERVEYFDPQGVLKVNILGRRGEGSSGFAYFCHTDVVPAEDWFADEHGPFDPTVIDGRLYARGSCDMKGSLATMLAAAKNFASQPLNHPVYVIATADEEIGFKGAMEVTRNSQMYRELCEGDPVGIIGEPTLLEVIHAHKGSFGFQITSKGRAAHSSTREGINANLAMIPFLSELKDLYEETETDPQWQDARFDPPTPTMNIGINDHNKAINITAAKTVCKVYLRPAPGMDVSPLLERVREMAAKHGLEFESSFESKGFHVKPTSPFVREILELTGHAEPRTVCYGTDGAVFGQQLSKMVVCGPGDIAQAHTRDEWISLDQLKAGTDFFSRVIERYCVKE